MSNMHSSDISLQTEREIMPNLLTKEAEVAAKTGAKTQAKSKKPDDATEIARQME